jgi:hypothetical protein
MTINQKIAFVGELNGTFNEIWLVRVLHSFWHNIRWNFDDITSGMMFMIHHNIKQCDVTIPGTTGPDKLTMLEAISGPLVVTEVTHLFSYGAHTVRFQPNNLKASDLKTNEWNGFEIWCHNSDMYTFLYQGQFISMVGIESVP